MPLQIFKTEGANDVWKTADSFPMGAVLSARNTGRLYLVVQVAGSQGYQYHTKCLVRLDDESMLTLEMGHFKDMYLREIKATLQVIL